MFSSREKRERKNSQLHITVIQLINAKKKISLFFFSLSVGRTFCDEVFLLVHLNNQKPIKWKRQTTELLRYKAVAEAKFWVLGESKCE